MRNNSVERQKKVAPEEEYGVWKKVQIKRPYWLRMSGVRRKLKELKNNSAAKTKNPALEEEYEVCKNSKVKNK